MVETRAHRRLRSIFGTLAKLLFGVIVFGTTIGAYTYLSDAARMHSPLPDDKVLDGGCAVWLIGSSSIHRWETAEADLNGWQVHNRGIEGARLPELQKRLDLTKSGAEPTAIILYAGENDLSDAVAAPIVLAHLKQIAATLIQHAPRAKLFLVSMKPSPARWNDRSAQLAVNAGLEQIARLHPNIYTIEAGDLLLTGGKPGAFYRDDGIHLSQAGYTRWGGEIERQLNAQVRRRSEQCGAAQRNGEGGRT